MPNISLVVIADPSSPYLGPLSRMPADLQLTVTDNLEQLKTIIPTADAILYASFSPALVQILPMANRVRWIHVLWTGVDALLTPDMLNHPAVLTNGRGVFSKPLADWVAAVMLFFAFDFRRVIRQQEARLWEPFISNGIEGRTLGIVGYGSIGRAVAARIRPFGVKIAALRRRPELFQGDSLVDRGYGPGQLKELMAASDYVVLVTPLTAETRNMVGSAEIAVMKPDAVFINIGRGPVLDEGALIEALESQRIRGAALDVFQAEPLPQDHPFWRMPNVFLSPHCADRVAGFLEPAFDCFFENLDR
ncbi:MAG TPA: D-2-hydroxyacid dehydrogenase, partial [Terriglobia bacterium]